MKRLMMCCALSCMLLANAASADLIVDTGQPSVLPSALSVSSSQWLAGEFTLGQAYTVTDVVGWMFEIGTGEGNMTVAIYDDGGDVPDATSELYSQTFYADLPDGPKNACWVGAEGVSWDLGPGTYWAAFEVRTGSTQFYMPCSAPSPLANYANFWPTPSPEWGDLSSPYALGMRVYGDEVVVPVPGAALLGALGLIAAGWRLRKRRTL